MAALRDMLRRLPVIEEKEGGENGSSGDGEGGGGAAGGLWFDPEGGLVRGMVTRRVGSTLECRELVDEAAHRSGGCRCRF